jgi:hypothetical protein
MESFDTAGRKWVSVPNSHTPQTTGGINGVWLNPGEEVDWCWVHNPSGSYVNGYTIKPKSLRAKKGKKS